MGGGGTYDRVGAGGRVGACGTDAVWVQAAQTAVGVQMAVGS